MVKVWILELEWICDDRRTDILKKLTPLLFLQQQGQKRGPFPRLWEK